MNNMEVAQRIGPLVRGNPGAIMVVAGLYHKYPDALVALERLNIRGSDIWLIFKDWAGQDLELLAIALESADADMLKALKEAQA